MPSSDVREGIISLAILTDLFPSVIQGLTHSYLMNQNGFIIIFFLSLLAQNAAHNHFGRVPVNTERQIFSPFKETYPHHYAPKLVRHNIQSLP